MIDMEMAGKASSSSSSWCGCPSSVKTSETTHFTQCPVCMCAFDPDFKVPIGLRCGHTICKKCIKRLHPSICSNITGVVDEFAGLPNIALLAYMEYPIEHSSTPRDPDCIGSMFRLADIATLLKGNIVSRAIHRKVLTLLSSLNPCGQNRLCKAGRAVGERALIELTSSCGNQSHYAQQQLLWSAIRARACQFLGPSLQEECLKLVLLALEDGSALSRKVLVMFVVQRLAPQFPQASKTSIGHVIQLLYRASCFDVTKRPEASSLMTLRPEFRNYDSLRREHDAQIVRIALDSGIRFSPEQWSSILYGDTSHKPHMQSIIDKLQAPQSFPQMTTEFIVSIQRLGDEDSNFLLQIIPYFQFLAAIELNLTDSTPPMSWNYTKQVLEAVYYVLIGLVNFSSKSTSSRPRHHYQTTAVPNTNSVTKFPRDSSFVGNSRTTPVTSPDEEQQIKELIKESQMVRAKMKMMQGKISEAEAKKLQSEVSVLEEEATKMMQNVGIGP